MPLTPIHRLLLPGRPRKRGLRLLLIVGITTILCTLVLVPLWIQGHSMAPGYGDGSFNLCWRGRYVWAEPQRGDIVVLRFASERELLLKRVLALAGDTIAFRDGTLLINGALVAEPYVRGPSNWNLELRRVEPGKVFVAGDNRAVPMERYHFGQIDRERIMGGLVW